MNIIKLWIVVIVSTACISQDVRGDDLLKPSDLMDRIIVVRGKVEDVVSVATGVEGTVKAIHVYCGPKDAVITNFRAEYMPFEGSGFSLSSAPRKGEVGVWMVVKARDGNYVAVRAYRENVEDRWLFARSFATNLERVAGADARVQRKILEENIQSPILEIARWAVLVQSNIDFPAVRKLIDAIEVTDTLHTGAHLGLDESMCLKDRNWKSSERRVKFLGRWCSTVEDSFSAEQMLYKIDAAPRAKYFARSRGRNVF